MPTGRDVNQQMLDAALGRMDRLDGVQRVLDADLADPTAGARRAELQQARAGVLDARGVLGVEVQIRQRLGRAYAGSTSGDPDQDPAVKEARRALNHHKRQHAEYG
jgi:hypothetical protein